MNVAMMQPTFLPWQGYFELLYRSDIFIFLDDFQFSVQSYHQRNRLFVDKGRVDWCTVPVLKSVSFGLPLNQTVISEVSSWRQKMWKRIQHNYSKAPFFAKLAPQVQAWLQTPAASLADQNMRFIMLCAGFMGIRREIRRSSQFPSSLQSSERVVALLRWSNASRYYCAKGSFSYMDQEGVFPVKDIEVLFQNYRTRPYSQVGSPDCFIPSLSILDALMNIGPEQTFALIRAGSDRWLTWDEQKSSAAALAQDHGSPEAANDH